MYSKYLIDRNIGRWMNAHEPTPNPSQEGNEALEILERHPIDVVVSDIAMPHCDGYELTKIIKSRDEWKHIPVMALTVLSGEEDRRKGIEAGIDEYKIKLDREEVLRALELLILRNKKNA